MIEVKLKRRLSETKIPCTCYLNGVPYRSTTTPAVAFDYWWSFDDDPTMRPEFLCTAERGVPISVPFNTQGRNIRLYQIARTKDGRPSDPLIKEAVQYVLHLTDAVVVTYGGDTVTYGGDTVTY